MATSRLIPMHKNKGKTIAQCLADRTDYAKNPDKTNDGELVSSYECDPKTVQGEFMLAKRTYLDITGRTQENDVIAYQIRQSFKPGEITPELANKLGYELALNFTKGRHAFIVATHVDKAHIHSHIIFNSTSLDCTRKFRNFWGSTYAVGRLSDRICLENGLSIVENPKKSKGPQAMKMSNGQRFITSNRWHRLSITCVKTTLLYMKFLNKEPKKLPTIKSLQAEYAVLLSTKKKAYATYKITKKDMQEILRAKENVDRILDIKEEKRSKKNHRKRDNRSCVLAPFTGRGSQFIVSKGIGNFPTSVRVEAEWATTSIDCHDMLSVISSKMIRLKYESIFE